jgi:dephospho-CoA kinase
VGKWAGKYVIGLTGNIGTGKSVVRRMLEHMGAFGIDADSFSHRAIAKGAPGYNKVIQAFGKWVVGPDEEIDRAKLGRLVFSDKQALAQLEAIIHPLVLQAVDWLVERSTKPIVVVEAIKLLETGMHKSFDNVWVVYAPPEAQLARLMQKRRMSEAEARQRIQTQSPQELKIKAAGVVIRNTGSFEETWRQVNAAWKKTVPAADPADSAPAASAEPATEGSIPQGELSVVRGRPRDAQRIADLLNRLEKGRKVTADQIMAEFGDKAFLLVRAGELLVGTAAWQVENLVARTTDIIIDPRVPVSSALPGLIQEMESASRDLQCEASLVLTSASLAVDPLWQELGYARREPQTLGVAAWQEAAVETIRPGQTLYFKQLRQDRVLRPI